MKIEPPLPQGERIPNSARLLKMLRKLKKFSLTFSPKALLFGRPDRSLLRDNRVLFSLGLSTSKTDCCCLPVVLSTKEESYINFRVLHTKVKLFNSFLCKTTYSLLFKEQITIILKYFRFSSKKPLIKFKNRRMSDSSSPKSGRGFLRQFNKGNLEQKYNI